MWVSIQERYFTLSVGIFFMLVGTVGFIPNLVSLPTCRLESGVTSSNLTFYRGYGYLVGVFPTNLVYNIVHLVFGVLAIAVYFTFSGARIFNRGLAILCAWIAVMGLLPSTNTMFGLMPLFGNNVWLNALTAAIATYYGFIKPLVNTPVI